MINVSSSKYPPEDYIFEPEIHRRYMYCQKTEKVREVYVQFGYNTKKWCVVRFVYPDGRIHPMQPPISRLHIDLEKCKKETESIVEFRRKCRDNLKCLK